MSVLGDIGGIPGADVPTAHPVCQSSRAPAGTVIRNPAFGTLWLFARSGRLEVGKMAPDFRLPALDKTSYVQLSSFRGDKPVVLVFGSYT